MKTTPILLAFALLTLVPALRAQTPITSLPAIITQQGTYYFSGDLATAQTSGYAIDIQATNVVIDLNGHKLGGSSAGLGTTAVGIHALSRSEITIKNGTVRGFQTGIWLEDANPYTTSRENVIEDIRADQNTQWGVYLMGKNNIVRNCLIAETGGTTTSANTSTFGIYVLGQGARVLNNDVMQVTAVGTGSAYGVFITVASGAANSVVQGNRISTISAPGGGFAMGIDLSSGTAYLVSENRLSGMTNGIYFDGSSSGKYLGNLTAGVTTPFTGGTAVGTNN
jgi:hypothetical protein